jgi:sensor domain CHASE-containing protein
VYDAKLALSAKRIVEKQIQALEKARRDLSDYIEKQDYHFSEKQRTETEMVLGESLARVIGRQGAERTLERILKTK